MDTDKRVDLDKPRWNQNKYWGRFRYFFATTNPINFFKTNSEIERCKKLVDDYKNGEKIPDGTTLHDVYKAKIVVDSAFHPDTGDKMVVFGRMCAQVPMNMLITGCLVAFYDSTLAVIFWQWFNQSFNALVNYTNRSGNLPMPFDQLTKSYALATSGALMTAVGLNKIMSRLPVIYERFVPFIAVAAANFINIPLMRIKELQDGVAVYDENKNFLGESRRASLSGISSVVISRILMSALGMLLTPIIMETLEEKGVISNDRWIRAPIEIMLCGFLLIFAIPLCCAIYPQISPISINKLEPQLQKSAEKFNSEMGYFNKGL